MSPGVFPFFNAELELELPEMVFSPSLNKDVHGGFYDLVESLISDIYKKASIMQRVSGEESYQAIMESHDDLNVIRNDIMNRVVSVMDAATQFRPVFELTLRRISMKENAYASNLSTRGRKLHTTGGILKT